MQRVFPALGRRFRVRWRQSCLRHELVSFIACLDGVRQASGAPLAAVLRLGYESGLVDCRMTGVPSWRVALDEFIGELKKVYGSRFETVILYGSRSRNDADLGSDIDTLVVLNAGVDFWTEFERISPIASRVSLQHDVVISAIPVDRWELQTAANPLLANVRREGVRMA
jgi:predicted nucleotidyltransferase